MTCVRRPVRTITIIACICAVVHAPAADLEEMTAPEGFDEGVFLGEEGLYDSVLSVSGNGEADALETSNAEFETLADLPTVVMMETAAQNLNGCEWVRNIHARRGEFVLITDRLRARAPGEYTVGSDWTPPAEGELRLENDRLLVMEREDPDAPGRRLLIRTDGAFNATLVDGADDGDDAVALSLRFSGELEQDDTLALHTLFYEDTDAESGEWDLRRISDEAVLILRDEEPDTVVVMGEEADIPGQARMRMGAFTRSSIWAADMTDLRDILRTEQPIHGEVRSAPTTHATVIGPEDLKTISVVGMPLMLEGGRLEMDLAGLGDISAGIVELETLFDSFVERAIEPPRAELTPEAPA